MYAKTDGWLDLADKIYLRILALAGEIGAKSAKKHAVAEVSDALGRSEVLVRRYLTADHSLSALLPLAPNLSREDFRKLPFSVAEFIGRMRSIDEDLALSWLVKAIDGKVKVVEVRAAYEELAKALNARKEDLRSEGKQTDSTGSLKDPQSTSARDHRRLVEFKEAVISAGYTIFRDNHANLEESNDPIPLEGVLEVGPIFHWKDSGVARRGTFVGLPSLLFNMRAVFRSRMGRIGFSALYFDEYWLVIEDPSSEVALMNHIRFFNDLDLPSIGLAVLRPKSDQPEIYISPDPGFNPRPFPVTGREAPAQV